MKAIFFLSDFSLPKLFFCFLVMVQPMHRSLSLNLQTSTQGDGILDNTGLLAGELFYWTSAGLDPAPPAESSYHFFAVRLKPHFEAFCHIFKAANRWLWKYRTRPRMSPTLTRRQVAAQSLDRTPMSHRKAKLRRPAHMVMSITLVRQIISLRRIDNYQANSPGAAVRSGFTGGRGYRRQNDKFR